METSGEDYCCEECFAHTWLRTTISQHRFRTGCCLLIGEPISRGDDKALYRKTQLFGYIVRAAMQLDGIRFRSSLNFPDGVNLALFDPALVTFSNSRLVKVTRSEVAYEKLASK